MRMCPGRYFFPFMKSDDIYDIFWPYADLHMTCGVGGGVSSYGGCGLCFPSRLLFKAYLGFSHQMRFLVKLNEAQHYSPEVLEQQERFFCILLSIAGIWVREQKINICYDKSVSVS